MTGHPDFRDESRPPLGIPSIFKERSEMKLIQLVHVL